MVSCNWFIIIYWRLVSNKLVLTDSYFDYYDKLYNISYYIIPLTQIRYIKFYKNVSNC